MDRAEAIKRLEDLVKTWDGDPFVQESVDAFKMAIAALREQSVTDRHQWISVKERLPEAHRLVLCRWTRGIGASYGFARYQHDDVWYVSNEGMPEVTHWMQLPEPPAVQPSEVSPSGNVNRKEGAE